MRRVDVLLAPGEATPERLRGTSAVVIDVLRATTVIAHALAGGAAGVVPVETPEDAARLARQLGRDRVLLGGERRNLRIEGFDLDNAPASYAPGVVRERTVILTTTNGPAALARAAHAAVTRTAALVNRSAVAAALVADRVDDAVIVCAGTHGGVAFEDVLGAGALVDAVAERRPEIALADGARAAAIVFRACRDDLAAAVASGDHAQTLAALGFATDLVQCAALDALDVVPTLREGILVDAREPRAAAAAG